MSPLRALPVAAAIIVILLSAPYATSQASVQQYDFQPPGGAVAAGYAAVTPGDSYSQDVGYGFTAAPRSGVDGARHAWNIYGRRVRLADAIPASVLTEATSDSVVHAHPFTFRTDVAPGHYDVTVWLGDVTRPQYLVHADVNGVPIDVERLDVVIFRGRLDQTMLPDRATPGIGNAVPRTVRVDATRGYIDITVGPGENRGPISWDYTLDECPTVQPPEDRNDVIVPAFAAAGLQAVTVRPAAATPLIKNRDGDLVVADAPADPGLLEALELFNADQPDAARETFMSLTDPSLRAAVGNGLLWVAGHPGSIDSEPGILADAQTALEQELVVRPDAWALEHLLLQVRLAADAERYRRRYGYGGTPASENMGRSNSIVEQFQQEHPYYLKGRILWLRNRGGLDPRRCTVSWERSQWMARQMDPIWGAYNPYVHLYATDEWENEGRPWTFIDWSQLAGEGPEWARVLVGTLNSWLDLFEWWAIHRQRASGEIGGGWTDDVEIVPAFGLSAYVLEDASHLSEYATIRFVDGIWNSRIIDSERGYQAQYADVEHTAEPTGNSLHMYPMLRYGDPEGMERIMKSGRTFAQTFLGTTTQEHTHFLGNYMSATEIARNPNHRGDIPLNGRVTQPFPFLIWYSSNPGIEEPLRRWAEAWVEDAAGTEHDKPAGIFPQFVWVPTDDTSYPDGTTPWYSRNQTYGQFGDFAAYQYYLYNLAGLFYLRTGDEAFREPFDALQRCAMEWTAAGRPSGNAPQPGQECAWAGGKLANVAGNSLFEVARATGRSDWDRFLRRFATSYSRFYMNPSEEALLNDQMDEIAATLADSWPYRTTEGLMTDRILLPGWYNVIAYYLGANVPSFFYGLPVQAATWGGTGRLFAAAVTEATSETLAATTYLFADASRTVQLKPWGLDHGGEYVLEAGPAAGIGDPPSTIEQTVPFTLDRRDEGVSFTMPGRTVYSVRIRQTSPGSPTVELMADLGGAPRDVTYDPRSGSVTVRVHNIGSVSADSIVVHLHAGRDRAGPLVGTATIPLIEAPIDLTPRWHDVTFDYRPTETPAYVTVVLDPDDQISEITEANNVFVALIGGRAPGFAPPMLLSLDPIVVKPGGEVDVVGRNFRDGIVVLESESDSSNLVGTFVDGQHLTIRIAADAPEGTYLVSVRNADGQKSNLLPLRVTGDLPPPTPTPAEPPATTRIYLPATFNNT